MIANSRSLRQKLLISVSLGSLLFSGVAEAQSGRISRGRAGVLVQHGDVRRAQRKCTLI